MGIDEVCAERRVGSGRMVLITQMMVIRGQHSDLPQRPVPVPPMYCRSDLNDPTLTQTTMAQES